MDIEDGLTINADTGAIALLEKSVQIRENYPEVDSDDSNPTKATSSKNRATPYTKPTIVRKPPLARQEEYIVIRKASEVSLARLSSELKSLTEGQPGRRTKEKSQKIDDLKKQIDLHKQQIAQADEAIVKLRSQQLSPVGLVFSRPRSTKYFNGTGSTIGEVQDLLFALVFL